MTKAKRNIIKIDEDKCNGCGNCVPGCKEGALQIIDGKAKLVSEVYCDGLGACLGHCPTGALTIEEREADEFDEAAVDQHVKQNNPKTSGSFGLCPQDDKHGNRENVILSDSEESRCTQTDESRVTNHESRLPCGCPGTMAKSLKAKAEVKVEEKQIGQITSQLGQWPVQLALIPVQAPYLKNADLVLLADCTAVAYANLHRDFIRDKVVAMACPKLDDTGPYVEKLAEMMKVNSFHSIEVVMMEVPCCGGLIGIASKAKEMSGSDVRLRKTVVSLEGEIMDDE